MPQSIIWSQFQAGWIPSDDPIKGRKNGLLQMDNVELDQNGALQLCGGVHDTGIAYDKSHPPIRMNNRVVGGSARTYAVCTDGTVHRDGTVISLSPQTVSAATLDANAVLTVPNTIGYTIGITIALTGFTDVGWNGSYTLLGITANSLTVQLDSRALTYTGAGTPTVSPSGVTASRGAFSSAFDSELICVNQAKLKDDGTNTVNLGIATPTTAITFGGTPITLNNTPALGTVSGAGTGAGHIYVSDGYGPPGCFVPQCDWAVGTIGTVPAIDMIDILPICGIQSYNLPNQPVDWSVFPDGTPFSDSDYMDITLSGWTTNEFKTMYLDFLLSAPTIGTYGPTGGTWTGGYPVADYYRATINYSDLTVTTVGGGVQTGTVRIYRSNFVRVGSGTQTWSTVYGWHIIQWPDSTPPGGSPLHIQICGPGDATYPGGFAFFMDTATTTTGAPNGYYEYAQQNGNQSSSYLALSELGPKSTTVQVSLAWINYIFQDPTQLDPQINVVYIYRRNSTDPDVGTNTGLLDQWYRVATITKTPTGWITQQQDKMGDQAALTLDQTINLNLVSVANIIAQPDPILEIIGPIEGRWFYFTKNFMYPSDINDPDLFDASLGIRTAGSSETFYWARMVSAAMVLVGTSNDIYLLTGTFRTLPDYTVDVYYQGLGCKFPPVGVAADVYSSVVFYLSSDGWRSYNAAGNNTWMVSGSQLMPYGTNPLWVSPNIDCLYRGVSPTGYSAVDYSSPYNKITIAKNKMWCSVVGLDGKTRIDVYDFIRQYWRPYKPTVKVITDITTMVNGGILGAIWDTGVSCELYELDYDGTADAALTVSIQFMTEDGGVPKQRKDSENLKIRFLGTTTGTTGLSILKDANNLVILTPVASNAAMTELAVDISTSIGICKLYQLTITGAYTAFRLLDAEILFDLRPQQTSYLRILSTNYNASAPKRVYTVPFVADLMGNTITGTPIVDGVAQTPTTFTGTGKLTYQFDFGEITPPGQDVLRGTDYEYVFETTGNALFEFFGMGEVKTLQIYPDRQIALFIPTTNFGSANKKRLRVWPFVIDTWGTPSTFTPIVDGVVIPSLAQTFTTTEEKTVFVQYTQDVFGVDYGGFWSGIPFSMFKAMDPDIVQVLPIARRFDQVGSEELFRYGRIKRIELRVLPFGGGGGGLS